MQRASSLQLKTGDRNRDSCKFVLDTKKHPTHDWLDSEERDPCLQHQTWGHLATPWSAHVWFQTAVSRLAETCWGRRHHNLKSTSSSFAKRLPPFLGKRRSTGEGSEEEEVSLGRGTHRRGKSMERRTSRAGEGSQLTWGPREDAAALNQGSGSVEGQEAPGLHNATKTRLRL